MLTFDDPVDASAVNKEEDFAFFGELPNKCRGLVIPLWMIEKLYVDFTSSPEQLVVQLKKAENHEESHEGN